MSKDNMDRNRQPVTAIHSAADAAQDKLDRLLTAHFTAGEDLAPSSGFASSVMETLEAETAAPAPIAFPWRRVLPGVIAVLCAMTVFAVFLLRLWKTTAVSEGPSTHELTGRLPPAIHLTSFEQALVWTAVAAVMSLAGTVGSMRLAGAGRR